MIHFSGGKKLPINSHKFAQFCILSEIPNVYNNLLSAGDSFQDSLQIAKSTDVQVLYDKVFVYNLCMSSHIFYIIFRLSTILIYYKFYVNSCWYTMDSSFVFCNCLEFFLSVFLICGWLNLQMQNPWKWRANCICYIIFIIYLLHLYLLQVLNFMY